MKFKALCQSGLGSSFMVQMNIQNILEEENVKTDIKVDHSDIGSTTEDQADYFFLDPTLETSAGNLPKDKIVILNSLIDADELKEKVNAILDKNGIAHD
ncbi:MAG: PTS sugar transporter subunit IIB [Lactobacillus panisapium]|uniref:PTS sugar transporter subunit IIB n=1 Tax=Lactobacillus TaxID=1578 RepID=UPI000CDAE571|nr:MULTISPECIES: PTS sugar transporter subunit IIB [Lactobacillus]MCO6530205.1 PTS sugar transporter subunit IIB [Lactobacillus sp.]MCO6534357.1 PTS sugar transporter subunit IIB [Lactobacillus sp.]MCX8724590.1 PTS sugar transporter subunit IIB [Lactobacillus sp. B4007]